MSRARSRCMNVQDDKLSSVEVISATQKHFTAKGFPGMDNTAKALALELAQDLDDELGGGVAAALQDGGNTRAFLQRETEEARRHREERARHKTEHGRAWISWKGGGVLVGGALILAAGGYAFGQERNVGQENKPVEVTMSAEPADKADAKTLGKVQVRVGASGEAKWFTPGAGKAESFRDCATDCPEMVVVPSGSFMMGSPEGEGSSDEHPQHRVTIKQPFAVSKFEVTFAEWDACVSGGGCKQEPETLWGRGRQPVMRVSWDDITKEYLPWLRKKTGKEYRLLSEAEWEYAARAGTTTAYSTGQSITKKQAQFSEGQFGSAGKTVEVGSFAANAFGLHDMHGNVWEWTEDCYQNNYNGAPTDGSAGTTGGCAYRVLRGGSWGSIPQYLRAAVRDGDSSVVRLGSFGFRVSRTF